MINYNLIMGEQAKTRNPASECCSVIMDVAISIFCIYALAKSDTPEVTAACGPNLWSFVLVRLLTAIMIFLLFILLLFLWPNSAEEIITISILLMHICFSIAGGAIVVPAMSNETCRIAMSTVDSSHSPILGIAGLIFFFTDLLTILVITCCSCLFFLVMAFTNQ
jgi:hypothetical protein